MEQPEWNEPCYVISIVARMVGLNVQTLRYYERTGVLSPSRTRGNIRLYSPQDVSRVRRVKSLINDLGVNLAGAEVIIRLSDRLQETESMVEALGSEVERLRAELGAVEGARGESPGSSRES